MKEILLGYGKKKISLKIKEENVLDILYPNEISVEGNEEDKIKKALENPIGSPRLRDIVSPDEKVAIVTSDITRPTPSKKILPYVLDELASAGVKDDDITVVFALGSHRKHTEEEKKFLVGEEVYRRVKCIDSDENDCVLVGYTKRGTPVEIFRPIVEADRRICIGNIEYHYFAGYSGGAKALMPGVSTRRAIQCNHSMMVQDGASVGIIEGNPVREDIDEVAKFVPIDFILNVILDENKKIIEAVAGNYILAHREGCKFLDSLYKVKVKEKADIVITSPGGYPKDINLYQAQKALDNAKHAVKKGGIIILVASCTEGYGEETFEKWMKEATSPEELIERIKVNFVLGGHKAAAIAMVARDVKIFLVSDMPKEIINPVLISTYSSLDEALEEAFKLKGNDAKALIIPYGGSILPVT